MDAKLLTLAAKVIQKSTRERPADGVLRDEFKASKGLARHESAEVSHAVFAYYRWFGWLEESKPLSERIESALGLAERFARAPGRFTDEELQDRAVPGWVKREAEVTATWARALQGEPKLWLRARRGRGIALADRLGVCRVFGSGPLSDILEYSGSEDLFRTTEFQDGEFEVQDISSQAVGLACNPQPGETWWDACAGEGGKLLHLSDLMGNKGLIWASDRASWRLQKLKRRTARAKAFNYRAADWDGGAKLPTKTKFDGVLVDAPCTGIGTWQRNPHGRWTTTINDVEELSRLQAQILANVAASVKPGGKLFYTVCTLARSETLAVAGEFEAKFAEFERFPLVNPLDPSAAKTDHLMLTPDRFGGNGMFIVAWTRRLAP